MFWGFALLIFDKGKVFVFAIFVFGFPVVVKVKVIAFYLLLIILNIVQFKGTNIYIFQVEITGLCVSTI